MKRGVWRFVLVFLVCAAFSGLPADAKAGVVAFDDVTTPGHPVFLKFQTTRMLFPDGGRRVSVRVDEGAARTLLTGGDGRGYLKMTFTQAGMKTVSVESPSGRDRACLLVVRPDAPTLVVEAVAGMRTGLFQHNEREICRRVLGELAGRFTIIYLGPTIGLSIVRGWLADNGFPPGPVLESRGRPTILGLQKRGVAIGALVGSAELATRARDLVEHRYAFEEGPDAVTASGWEDLLRRLRPPEETSGKHGSEPAAAHDGQK